ncbi:AAA family ATPase [Dehalococcoides mccartyi]|uniref:AAA family ATPase n=1 Tax=Dehalococcoides mccartyi TaxID=61435 RepID=UPI002FCB8EA0
MKVKAISLSWFRGAADAVSLEPNCKSMVIYGENGAGKSSFVDAIEYVLNGKIGHLAHEYSGKHQEKAVPNTHKPEKAKTELSLKFADDSELRMEINANGSSTTSGADSGGINTWDYRRTVLRQNEVAAFILDTKGEKYSTLLPLLGLEQLELAASNLRQLVKSIEQQSKIKEMKGALKAIQVKRIATFSTNTDDQIIEKIEGLYAKHCRVKTDKKDTVLYCIELELVLEATITRFSSNQKRYLAIQSVAEADPKSCVKAVRSASIKLAEVAEPLIAERLEVLESAGTFAEKLGHGTEVKCPACGQSVAVEAFQSHVTAERKRLQKIIETFDTRKTALGALSDCITLLKTNAGQADAKPWRDELVEGGLTSSFAYLDKLDIQSLRKACSEDELATIESNLLPIVDAAAKASQQAPPDIREISLDKAIVETGKAILAAREQAIFIDRTEALISFLNALEQGIRNEIKHRSKSIMGEISADIRTMWSVLHPLETIEDVSLYLPEDADKAIDVSLKFHGVPLESPRLTLSEGYRNSLGLCIFLAMAKREAAKDRPLFLDDVVVSLDRNHRGMLVGLLEKDFTKRQVVVLTHDREWYAELRHMLDSNNWTFRTLLPYVTPDIGIRWSTSTTTFGDARAQLDDRPDSAGNDARKIMDVELALITESFQIRMPYMRGEKNDRRMAHDFLERLLADGKKCFQKKVGQDYVAHVDALTVLEQADRLLVAWGNRASHSFDVVRPEAEKLIDTCEKALEQFKCESCKKVVWFAGAEGPEWVQCQCGEIRWRYGKA